MYNLAAGTSGNFRQVVQSIIPPSYRKMFLVLDDLHVLHNFSLLVATQKRSLQFKELIPPCIRRWQPFLVSGFLCKLIVHGVVANVVNDHERIEVIQSLLLTTNLPQLDNYLLQ